MINKNILRQGLVIFSLSSISTVVFAESFADKYDKIDLFVEGVAQTRLNGKFGYIDKTGKEVAPPKYDDAEDFSKECDCAKVSINKDDVDYYGVIDKTGKEIIPLQYKWIEPFSKGYTIVTRYGGEDKFGHQIKNVRGVIDTKGKIIVPAIYDMVYLPDAEGITAVSKDGKWGYVDSTGKLIIPMMYQSVTGFDEFGTSAVFNFDGSMLFINKQNIPQKRVFDERNRRIK